MVKKALSPAVQRLQIQPQVNSIVDQLASDSASLPAAIDDVVATVDSPQDPAEMSEELQHLHGVVLNIQSRLDALFALQPVGDLMKESISATGKSNTDIRKWFQTCFKQIEQLTSDMSKSLQDEQ